MEFKGALASLGDGVFSGCNGLNSVVLPRGLRAIAPYTFDGCSSIEEIIVPQDVVEIDNLAFANCYNLHRVELPASLSRVVSGAFSGSDYIFAVYNQSALELSGDMFGDVLVVSSDRSKTLLTYHTENEFAFVKADGTWYLYDVMYTSDVTTILPDYFIADGERIERYKVRGGATGLAGRNLLVSKSVTGLRRNALRENISMCTMTERRNSGAISTGRITLRHPCCSDRTVYTRGAQTGCGGIATITPRQPHIRLLRIARGRS